MAGDTPSDDHDDAGPVVVPDRAYGFPKAAFDPSLLPDVDTDFLPKDHIEAFIAALSAPDFAHNPDDVNTIRLGSPVAGRSSFDVTRRQSLALDRADDAAQHTDAADHAQQVAAHAAAAAADVTAPAAQKLNGSANASGSATPGQHRDSLFITAQNDWAPVNQKVPRSGKPGKRRKRPRPLRPGFRTRDETREGYSYGLLKWPFLVYVGCWLMGLSVAYMLTRYYIWCYEYFISWRGRRETLRRNMRATADYRQWRAAAKDLDDYFGNDAWKEKNEFAYYDCKTVKRVWDSMKQSRQRAQAIEKRLQDGESVEEDQRQEGEKAVEALTALLVACVKNNFVGVENPRLYSQTYYGTKNLVQNHVDEGMFRGHFAFFFSMAGTDYANSGEESQLHPPDEADGAR